MGGPICLLGLGYLTRYELGGVGPPVDITVDNFVDSAGATADVLMRMGGPGHFLAGRPRAAASSVVDVSRETAENLQRPAELFAR